LLLACRAGTIGGRIDILFLNMEQVEALIDLDELLVELEKGFGQLSAGDVNAPERNEISMPREAFLPGMPGHRGRLAERHPSARDHGL
jgi:hypothetical protein